MGLHMVVCGGSFDAGTAGIALWCFQRACRHL